ncbi:acyl-CoA/acyl-ACP dehydrogenase [Diaphorobacter sp. HDW4A]|uniref:acyl-CoA dehydrogenase family protein n=1 Tax=Diaphorobacter sp. HDW4A TaxID=2714924 RepID=UPI001407BC81|nr:acyl-CoA dehydrogenase family protein [Diaphorobacter sp. HDW4A]QIL79286.1 acyl-CoA/acyl-ACP dehydrogenase [Diaphorobacter sp. HDW4A]
MDFKLTEDQEMLVDAAKKISERHLQPLLLARNKRTALSKHDVLEILSKAADIGLTSARIPEEGGGMGMKMLDYGLVMEQIAPTIGLIVQPHEATTTRIYFGGSEQQKQRFVPGLMAGTLVGATGSTEPDCGSDPRGIKTTGEWSGDDIVVNGRKQWISNSTVCDVIHITCRVPKEGGGYRMGRILVDCAESPFEAEEVAMHGLCQAPLGEVSFSDCRVPAANICPDDENTAKLLTITWLANRPAVGLMAVHLGQKALDLARDYVGVRKQFGKHIGAFQSIQVDLADIETLVMSSRLLCYNALSAIDHGARANGLSAMAKRYAVDACDRAIALAMRIHGAMGLSEELGLEQMARDVRTLTIPDGTPGILALIQGRELTGMDAFRA